jgi:hypothetical protein
MDVGSDSTLHAVRVGRRVRQEWISLPTKKEATCKRDTQTPDTGRHSSLGPPCKDEPYSSSVDDPPHCGCIQSHMTKRTRMSCRVGVVVLNLQDCPYEGINEQELIIS